MTRTCFAGAVFRLENTGTKTANSVQVDLTATAGFLLRPRASDGKARNTRDRDLMLPRCPDPPQGKYVDNLGSWAESLAQLQGMRPPEGLRPCLNTISARRADCSWAGTKSGASGRTKSIFWLAKGAAMKERRNAARPNRKNTVTIGVAQPRILLLSGGNLGLSSVWLQSRGPKRHRHRVKRGRRRPLSETRGRLGAVPA